MRMNLRTIAYAGLKLYWRVFRPTVLGSRAIVIKDDSILLVRLSYTKGWYLPGGGVDRGESFEKAIVRELIEECAIEAHEPKLFGKYQSTKYGKKDEVALFVVRKFSPLIDSKPDAEILEAKFFPLNQLPQETTPATKRRIEEFKRNESTEQIREW